MKFSLCVCVQENLLLTAQGNLKISDFGLSREMPDPETTLLSTHCGSIKYAAPEILTIGNEYRGPPCDVWSAAVILHVMVSGKFPFSEATTRCKYFTAHMIGNFDFEDDMSVELRDLLSRMWAVMPESRSSLYEVQQHSWYVPMAIEA